MENAVSIDLTEQHSPEFVARSNDASELKRSCARFISEIERILANHNGTTDFSKRTELFEALKDAARESGLSILPTLYAQLLNSRFESLRGMYLTYYQELEYRAARRIISQQLPMDSVFRSNNHALLQREITQADIHQQSKVAFVGCGCLPWTAIAIHQLTGAHVTGFDRDAALVQLGQKVVRQLGVSDKVHLHVAEGDNVDFSEFSHIYLAAMCDQKHSIALRMAEVVSRGSKLLIRSSLSPYQIFYPGMDIPSIPGFDIAAHARCDGVDELETFIFRKV